ncbi:MAG: response regulator [Oscillospiraceae bacterium]|nr:response regulator [Oscillospiraceae bacterium]
MARTIREKYDAQSAIIILTAYNWDDIIEEAPDAGVDSFMAKPLFASGVLQEFRQAIKNKLVSRGAPRRAEHAGKRILLAEDMEINAEITTEVLGMRDILVDHAENGQAALELFRKSEPGQYAAILMDVRMPVMTGLEATEAIRAPDRPDAKTIPIIAMTANAFDEDVQRSLQSGMNPHLNKPVEPDHLFKTLETVIKS